MNGRPVFFDFGGTLCESRADILPVFEAAAKRAKADLPLEAYLRANEECWNELWPQAPALVGRIPSFADRVHEMALRRIGFRGPVDALVRYIREEATSPRWHRPYPETTAVLTELRARGVPVHIISGNVDYLPITLANLGWSDLFDSVTFTQEVGVQKPDPRVFRFALDRVHQQPTGAVFVGDSWEADYLGATRVGMTAVWLNRTGGSAPSPCRQISTLLEVPPLLSSLDSHEQHPPR